MISNQMHQLAEKLNWKKDSTEDLIYGEYNHYRFTVMEGQGFKAIFTPVAGISAEALSAIKKHLQDQQKNWKLRNFELADNFLVVRLNEAWKQRTADQLDSILQQLSVLLQSLQLSSDACAICGLPAEKQGLLHGLFCALHPECLDQETVDFTQASESEPSDLSDDPLTDEEALV